MTDEEAEFSHHFKEVAIYDRMNQDWAKNVKEAIDTSELQGSNLSMTVIEDYCNYLRTFKPDDAIIAAWEAIYKYISTENANTTKEKMTKSQSRIAKNLDYFRQNYMKDFYTSEDLSNRTVPLPVKDNSKVTLAYYKDNKDKIKFKQYQHQYILPENLTTSIVLAFRTVPSKLISEVILVLATDMVYGNILPTQSNNEIIEYIKLQGGLEAMVKKFKHPMII